MTDALYQPSLWQQEFHALKVHEALGAGAAGVGKTLCLLMDPLEQIIMEHQRCQLPPGHPHHIPWGGSKGWALHLRREMTQLQQTIARSHALFKGIDPKAHWDRESHTWTFSSGYRFQFGHCKDADDHQKYLSSEFSHIAFDELSTFSKEQYDGVTSRLRSSDKVLRLMLKVRSMSNPGISPGSDPHWVRKLFVDPCPDGRQLLVKTMKRKDGTTFKRTRIYLPGRLTDNPDKQFAQDYEETLTDKPEHIRRAYLDGDWYFAPGSFFGEDWIPAIHVIKPFRIPQDWPCFRAGDWGFKSHGNIGWYAMDPDGDLYKFNEFTFKEMTDKEVAEQVQHIEKKFGLWDAKRKRSRISGPMDTQIWEERGDTAKRKIDVFTENGVPWSQADKKSRRDNAERLIKRLKSHKGGTRNPGLMVFNTCKYTISTIPQIRVDPLDPESPQKGGEDHAVDETMYACAFASHGTTRIHMHPEEDADLMDDEDEVATARGKGRYGYGSECG